MRTSSRRSLSQEEDLLRTLLRPRFPDELEARLGVRHLSMEGPSPARVRPRIPPSPSESFPRPSVALSNI